MNSFKKINYAKTISVLFFVIYFIVGCFIFDDYGVGWDEEAQHNIGAIVYEYASTKDSTELFVNQQYQYHGATWELFNYIVEVKLNKREFREYVLLKHFNNWLLFFTASIFLFFIGLKISKNTWLALMGAAMFILSPRIFAESFYNSKDVVSLSLYTISIYSMLRFLEKQSVLNLFFHAIVCALLIDVRITGITIPVFTFFFFSLNSFLIKKSNIKEWVFVLMYLFLTAVFVVLFWPVLWQNPIEHFINALQMMGKYAWGASVLYMGEYVSSLKLPWHYAPVWICITTPIIYLLLFLFSMFVFLKKAITSPLLFYKDNYFVFVFLACFFSPLLSIIILKSVLYDGWRHVYFIYPALVLICVWGVSVFYKTNSNLKLKQITSTVLIINIVFIIINMILNHPHQHSYFNFISGKGKTNQQNFEMDYWGISYKQALEKVAQNDTSKIIAIRVENFPGESNLKFLPSNLSNRFAVCNNREDYFITNYRWKNNETYSDYIKHDSIVSYGKEIYGIYVLKNKPVYSFEENFYPLNVNFTDKKDGVTFKKLSIDTNDVGLIETNNEYPIGTSWQSNPNEAKKVFVSVKFKIKTLGKTTKLNFVIGSRNTKNETTILMFCRLNDFLKLNKDWQNFEIVNHPLVIPAGSKIINVYFMNNNHNQFYIDDLEIKWDKPLIQ